MLLAKRLGFLIETRRLLEKWQIGDSQKKYFLVVLHLYINREMLRML